MSKRPIRRAVNGRLMSIGEAAAEIGVSRQTLVKYMETHRNPDGTPLSLQDTYDVYTRARRRGKRRVGRSGPEPRTYALDGGEMTARQMAEALGVPIQTIYRWINDSGGDAKTIQRKADKRRQRQAEREILAVIREGSTCGR